MNVTTKRVLGSIGLLALVILVTYATNVALRNYIDMTMTEVDVYDFKAGYLVNPISAITYEVDSTIGEEEIREYANLLNIVPEYNSYSYSSECECIYSMKIGDEYYHLNFKNDPSLVLVYEPGTDDSHEWDITTSFIQLKFDRAMKLRNKMVKRYADLVEETAPLR